MLKSYTTYHIWDKAYTTNFTNGNIEIDYDCRTIKLPKTGKVKAKLHREFTGRIKSATISQAPSGKYFVSVLAETEHIELVHTTSHVGLDLGIKDLCITSGGIKYENPKTLRKYERELARKQRQLAHKQKGSSNYKKQKRKIARCHEKIHNIRKNHLHLKDLIAKMPTNKDELKEVAGFGEVKANKYGDDVLGILKKFCNR